jgi:multiple sugar transport system ATP-binding protein
MGEIILKGVSKIFGSNVVAVDNIDLTIKDGEFMVLLGPSGCGKTTVLRMIAGLEEVTQGDIIMDGQRINDIDPADRDLAIVFQNYALYPHKTVAGNLSFGLKLRKIPRGEIEKRVDLTAKLLGLEELLDRKPRELSGGQQQRVALGRAMVRQPFAYLFDEPLSNLDAKLRASMRTELIKLHHELNTTIIHVTHDQVEAMTMGERICIMQNGKIVQVGPPLEVYRNPANAFVAGFLASPSMNLIDTVLTSGKLGLVAEVGVISLPIPEMFSDSYRAYLGQSCTLGIRPEDLHLEPGEENYALVDVTVVTVEALGPETVLIVNLPDGREIAARIDRAFSAQIGSSLRLYANMSLMHLFGKENGQVIPVPVR